MTAPGRSERRVGSRPGPAGPRAAVPRGGEGTGEADVRGPAGGGSGDGQATRHSALDAIQDRILWLAVRMIHEANVLRPSVDGLKVGGHQASSASVVSIITALYFRWLRAGDLVAIKPHASPAFHAAQYLLGNLDRRYLAELRGFHGLQAYPSRTKDPDAVDFSTGSVGLGGIAPLFAALADQFVRHHSAAAAARPARRFVALVGDAELDEGSVWEAVAEEALRGLGNVTLIVDLNRQSLDRVVPNLRVRQLEALFEAAGWRVVEAKYGARLAGRFALPGGDALRQRIDGMSNDEYQVLIRKPGGAARELLLAGTSGRDADRLARSVVDVPDAGLPALLADLGGHDLALLERRLDEAAADPTRPAVLFAYTIKGWRLPFAGDALNHSALLSADQIERLAVELGADGADPWASLDPLGDAGRLIQARRADLWPSGAVSRTRVQAQVEVPEDLPVRIHPRSDTQRVFGDALAGLARAGDLSRLLVTASPDVSVSTSLGGWINRAGVYGPDEIAGGVEAEAGLLTWRPGRAGRHIELGISETNLFMLLGQLGLSAELLGEPLVPIGTVYDPFICRGLDALIYGLYAGARFVIVGTPSGISLAPEGGAHQSLVTPSLGIELPGLRAFEPAFGREVAWTLLEGIRGVLAPGDGGFSTYLRLSTRPVDQALAEPVARRLGPDEWRRQTLAGGYRLLESSEADPPLPNGAPRVTVVASGMVVAEAAAATLALQREEIAADLVVVTSAERLSSELVASRGARAGGRPLPPRHLTSLLGARGSAAPLVTVLDGASHTLSFLGAAAGVPVIPLGVDDFGQSGTVPDLYRASGIDADHIVDAALVALEAAGQL